MGHVDSGWRCLVNHVHHGQCMKCSVCGRWISPLETGSECQGRASISALDDTQPRMSVAEWQKIVRWQERGK